MVVSFLNFEFSYERKGKPVYVPSDLGAKIGKDIKSRVESTYEFDDFVYHLKKNGGHVAALHAHRDHRHFARADIYNFFYGISRSRVQGALMRIGIVRSRHYAKWSCVRNPYADKPGYVLPYGFIQSPILATLVLMQSTVGEHLRAVHTAGQVAVSVYMDDISMSSNDAQALTNAFASLQEKLAESNFDLSDEKLRNPSDSMDVFNCLLSYSQTLVLDSRIAIFHSEPRSPEAIQGFADYCARVEAGNVP